MSVSESKCRWCHRPPTHVTFNGRMYCDPCFAWLLRQASEFGGPV